jgi:SAM-dependent methyltransferase
MNSQYEYARALIELLRSEPSWLDVGCGHAFLPEWMDTPLRIPSIRVVGVDLDWAAVRAHEGPLARVCGTIESLPIAAQAFDLVTANMVVEHLAEPERFFLEAARVLRPGGVLLVHTPNLSGYTTLMARLVPRSLRPRMAHLLQSRDERDVYPTFYRANTTVALCRLADIAGFEPADVRTIVSSPQLFRVPGARRVEQALLGVLERPALAAWRPCIIAKFVRRATA